jgi:kanamycin kinase
MELEQDYIDWACKELGEVVVATKVPFGDQNIVFKIQSLEGGYFLKIGEDLKEERKRLEWLKDKQPVPRIIATTTIAGKDALLLSAIEGANLKSVAKDLGIDKVIIVLVDALLRFHDTNINDCPFGVKTDGAVLVHGDASLPNFIVNNGELSGYIDLEDTRMDNRDVDLAAAVWSLQYNFGPGFGMSFLEKYGVVNPTEEMVERLHLQYEKMIEDWDIK